MSWSKTVNVALSLLGSNQRDVPQPGQTGSPSQTKLGEGKGKRGNKRAKELSLSTRTILKVKLPKLNPRNLSKKTTNEDKAQQKRILEPAVPKAKTTMRSTGGGGTQCAGTYSISVGADVYLFPQGPTLQATNEKEKAQLSVLRTISKMLEENQLIRQRLATLSQSN